MIAESLTCQELVELVTDYLEGALPEEERARFEEHVASCEGCSTHFDQMRTTIAVVGSLTPESLSAEAEAALLQAFRDWKRSD